MCLSFEWFDESESRKMKWDSEGLSLEEAKGALLTYYSSVYPVATEMAEYIFSDWSARRVALLDAQTRKILFEIWDNHISEAKLQETNEVEDGYSFKGIFFKLGLRLRLRTNPEDFAQITNKGIHYKDEYYTSFSAAANEARPHTQNNGWIQWEYYDEELNLWQLVDQKRKAMMT